MARRPAPEEFNPAAPLEQLAERVRMSGEQRDPIFEQSIVKGLREQAQASVEQTEQAAGLTGSAQVGAATLALLEQTGQAAMAAHARRVENERATLDLQAQLLGQAGQLREQRYETNLRHQEFLMQLKAQEDAQRDKLAATIAGGALSAFAGGGFGGLLAGAGAATTTATTTGAAATAATAVPQIVQAGMPAVTQAIDPFGGAMSGAYGLNALGLATGGRGFLY